MPKAIVDFEKWYVKITETLSSADFDFDSEKYESTKAQCRDFESGSPDQMSFLFMIDYTKMKYFYMSERLCELLGMDKERIYSEPLSYGLSQMHSAYMHKIHTEVFPEVIGYITGHSALNEERRKLRFTYNFWGKKKAGDYVPLVQRLSVLEMTPDGHPAIDLGVLTIDRHYCPAGKIILQIDKLDEEKIYRKLFHKEYVVDIEGENVFSPRELEIMNLLKKGLGSRQISGILSISEHTVKNHKRSIFKKAGVNKVTELISFLKEKGM